MGHFILLNGYGCEQAWAVVVWVVMATWEAAWVDMEGAWAEEWVVMAAAWAAEWAVTVAWEAAPGWAAMALVQPRVATLRPAAAMARRAAAAMGRRVAATVAAGLTALAATAEAAMADRRAVAAAALVATGLTKVSNPATRPLLVSCCMVSSKSSSAFLRCRAFSKAVDRQRKSPLRGLNVRSLSYLQAVGLGQS